MLMSELFWIYPYILVLENSVFKWNIAASNLIQNASENRILIKTEFEKILSEQVVCQLFYETNLVKGDNYIIC